MPIPTEDPNDPKRRPPIGGGPVGLQTPIAPPQASVPIVDAGQARPPIGGGPEGVQTAPAQPWVHPGNRRWREAKARGMTPEQFQQQGAAQVPNTAKFVPQGPAIPPDMSNIKPPAVDPRGYPQAYPQIPQPDPRMTAQRRYFGGRQRRPVY
jgi:hypothetical protein